jgi:hypothetical protein
MNAPGVSSTLRRAASDSGGEAQPIIRISIRPCGSDAALETARQADVAFRVAQGLQRFQLAQLFEVVRTLLLTRPLPSAGGGSGDPWAIPASVTDRDDAILIIDVLARPTGTSTKAADVWRQIGAALRAERLSAGQGEDDRRQ